VPLAGGHADDGHAVEGALTDEATAPGQVVGPGQAEPDHVHRHVDGDEHLRDDRPGRGQGRRTAVDLLATRPGALRAVEPDGGLDHALRADGPAAALTGHPGPNPRMAVAGGHLGGHSANLSGESGDDGGEEPPRVDDQQAEANDDDAPAAPRARPTATTDPPATTGRVAPGELAARAAHLARAPQLLVACDYDGTVAPLVDDPMAALPHRDTVIAMRALASLPQTHVAVISGRSLRDLATLSRMPQEIHLVGSHGTEFDIGFGSSLPPDVARARERVESALRAIALRTEGAVVEPKPAAVAFH